MNIKGSSSWYWSVLWHILLWRFCSFSSIRKGNDQGQKSTDMIRGKSAGKRNGLKFLEACELSCITGKSQDLIYRYWSSAYRSARMLSDNSVISLTPQHFQLVEKSFLYPHFLLKCSVAEPSLAPFLINSRRNCGLRLTPCTTPSAWLGLVVGLSSYTASVHHFPREDKWNIVDWLLNSLVAAKWCNSIRLQCLGSCTVEK